MVNGLWTYIVDTVFIAAIADSGVFYRVKVATTYGNLSDPKCAVNNSQKVFLKIFNINCIVLGSDVISLTGSIQNGKGLLKWNIFQRIADLNYFEIQKSADGITFQKIGTVPASDITYYSFIDPGVVNGAAYYRIKLINANNDDQKYTNVVHVSDKNITFKVSAINPFYDIIKAEVYLPVKGKFEINLLDIYGKIVGKKTWNLSSGNSSITMDEVGGLAPGIYILNGSFGNLVVQNKLLKIK